jgi:hypothetical protein
MNSLLKLLAYLYTAIKSSYIATRNLMDYLPPDENDALLSSEQIIQIIYTMRFKHFIWKLLGNQPSPDYYLDDPDFESLAYWIKD